MHHTTHTKTAKRSLCVWPADRAAVCSTTHSKYPLLLQPSHPYTQLSGRSSSRRKSPYYRPSGQEQGKGRAEQHKTGAMLLHLRIASPNPRGAGSAIGHKAAPPPCRCENRCDALLDNPDAICTARLLPSQWAAVVHPWSGTLTADSTQNCENY